ncbi:MAG TPA: cytoplasmic protein [Acidobacteriota bacterium]
MKKYFILGLLFGVAFTTAAFVLSSEVATSMDPVKISPQYYKVLLENDQVRVLEYRLKPGEKEAMHSHPAGIVYIFSDGRMKTMTPDGESHEGERKAGEVIWRDPVTHTAENTGSTEIHALAIEMKKQCN